MDKYLFLYAVGSIIFIVTGMGILLSLVNNDYFLLILSASFNVNAIKIIVEVYMRDLEYSTQKSPDSIFGYNFKL
ncbi:MAG: hypothetical protein ACW967_06625 [Candidatus Hodarchaeales archaeon]